MIVRILFADDLHFHQRGFNSLLDFIEHKNIEHIFIQHKEKDLLSCFGYYENHKSLLKPYYNRLKSLDQKQLFNYKYKTLKIFPLAKLEILSLVFSFDNWYNQSIKSSELFIFEKLYNENKEILLQNMAITLYWIDFWSQRLETYTNYSHCCIFSGTLIYQKTLIELLKNSQLKVMLFEHFFTGNDYYCEHKYDQLPNNSDIRFKNYYENYLDTSHIPFKELQNHKIKAYNKILNGKNKNVTQPKKSKNIIFEQQSKTILILGQVVNDFSMLQTQLNNISSINFYKQLIDEILNKTPYNIIFKTHPWEQKKANLKTSLTKNQLEIYLEQSSFKNRVKIVEDYNLQSLFYQSDHIITLCSQSGIEAAFEGRKVIQLGDAFYGNKGFTYDFNTIDQCVTQIDRLDKYLTIDEYKNFELFLVKILEFHLVSIYPSGIKTLEQKFSHERVIPLGTQAQTTISNKINSSLQQGNIRVFLQKLKKIPILGSSLLWIKHKILGWK